MNAIDKLKQERADLISRQRKVYDLATKEERSLTGEEQEADTKMVAEVDGILGRIQTAERAAELKTVEDGLRQSQRITTARQPDNEPWGEGKADAPYVIEFEASRGRKKRNWTFPVGSSAWHRNQPASREAFDRWLTGKATGAVAQKSAAAK